MNTEKPRCHGRLRRAAIICSSISVAGCGVLSTTVDDDALPDPNGQFYTILVASRTVTHRRQNGEGIWQVEKHFPGEIDSRQEQGFAKCTGPLIARESHQTRFLHEKWLYQAIPDLSPDKRSVPDLLGSAHLPETLTEAAKGVGLRFIVVLEVEGDWARAGWLSNSEGVTNIALPTIIGYEHGERSSSIKVSIYDIHLNQKWIVNAEVRKPYSVTGLALFPIANMPNVELEACEQSGIAIGKTIQKAIAESEREIRIRSD